MPDPRQLLFGRIPLKLLHHVQLIQQAVDKAAASGQHAVQTGLLLLCILFPRFRFWGTTAAAQAFELALPALEPVHEVPALLVPCCIKNGLFLTGQKTHRNTPSASLMAVATFVTAAVILVHQILERVDALPCRY